MVSLEEKELSCYPYTMTKSEYKDHYCRAAKVQSCCLKATSQKCSSILSEFKSRLKDDIFRTLIWKHGGRFKLTQYSSWKLKLEKHSCAGAFDSSILNFARIGSGEWD